MRGFLAKLCKKNGIAKRIGSMSLAILMALSTLQALPAGILVAHAEGTGNTVKSPVVDGMQVTFNYKATEDFDEQLYVRGDMNNWGTEQGEMLDEDGDNVYSCTFTLTPGSYQYKFWYDDSSEYGNWFTDPLNNETADGNSVVVVQGSVKSPVVDGTKVTFNYEAADGVQKVQLTGGHWGWNATTAPEMTKVDDSNVFTIEQELAPGTYQYKFIVDGASNWIADPLNSQKDNDGNSVVVVQGSVKSPVVDGTKVTFNYEAADGVQKVQLTGGHWGWNATTAPEMTKVDDSNVFTIEQELAPGTYQYKFIVDGASSWIADPLNSQKDNDGNSVVVVPSGVESPIINADGSITFNLAKGEYTSVEVMGTVPGCSWTVGSGFKMELDDTGALYTYTTEAGIAPGVYEYKFVADKAWIPDPSNTLVVGKDNNSAAVVPGLANAEVAPEKGVATDLPATLKSFTAGSTTSTDAAVTYTLDDTSLADVVTIDNTNHKITVAKSCTETEFTLIATAGSQTSKVYVKPTEKVYTYTIYYYDTVKDHMATDAAQIWAWTSDGDGAPIKDANDFSSKETLADGNGWLKAVIKTPSTDFGFKVRSYGGWNWEGSNHYYENTAKAENVTLYFVSSDAQTYTELPTLKEQRKRYVVVAYERTDSDYNTDTAGWNIYSWNSGFGNETEIYGKVLNGEYVMVVPVRDSEVDMNLGFCLRKSEKAEGGNKWAEKEGSDHSVTIPADQEVVKVYFEQGKSQVGTLPYNKSYDIDGSKDTITFYYRDDAALVAKNSAQLSETVKVVVDGTEYEMTYDAKNERYYYALKNCTNGDYEFSYKVGSKTVEDKFASKGVVTYKSFDDLSITATLSQATMDYNDNNVLTVAFEGDDAESVSSKDVESISANLSLLGLSSEFAISPELMEGTISVDRSVSAGESAILVTLKDKYGNTYENTVRVKVTERDEDAFDWDEAVIYMTCTDRFFDGNKDNNAGVDTTDTVGYHGGDFAGLTAKLDYLEDLGVNTIWITPIVQNSNTDTDKGYHGYWASDFTKLNSYLGTEEEFEELLTEAHKRDMKIMVDVVLNHAGYKSEDHFNSVMDDAEKGIDITMIRDPKHTIPDDDIRDSLEGLPDFMTEDPVVRDQLVEWQVDWIKKFDIDYYRVDTVKHVDNVTWQAFKNELTKANPDFKMIGEYYGAGYAGTGGALGTGTMDSLLDFDTNEKALDFVAGKISDVEAFFVDRNGKISNSATLGGFLSSHDEDSLVDKLMGGKDTAEAETQALALAKVAAALQITAKGQVVIYYGEEIGQHGLNNYPTQSNRNDFNWTAAEKQASTDGSMLKHYQKLLEIRDTYSNVFATGTRETIAADNTAGYDVFKRASGEDELFVALNIKSTAQNVRFATGAKDGTIYTDLYSGKEYKVDSGKVTVAIPATADGGTAILVETGYEEPAPVTDFNGDLAIHVQKPAGWSKINAYTWDKDTNKQEFTGTWPGTAMTVNVDNDGWYDIKLKDIELADSKLNMIFNNGSAQTSDTPYTIPVGTTDIWVTSVSASTVPTVTNEEPTGWKVLYDVIIHLDNDTKNYDKPFVYAFENEGSYTKITGDWPGKAMTENEANAGWVDYTLDDIAYDKIAFVFSNEGSDTGKTNNLECVLEDRTTEFWVSGSAADAPLSTTAPEGWKKFVSQDLTLHYWNTNDWADVYAYMHTDDTAVGEAWPGTELTQGSDSSWYSASIEGITTDTFKLTMNDGKAKDEADKDNDLVITLAEAENELWIKDGVIYDSNPDVNTGSPIVKGTEVTFNFANTTSETVYLQGGFNGWSGGDEYIMTDPDGDGIVSITITLEPGTYQYKFQLKESNTWLLDPQNDNKADDGYGGNNSVVEVSAMGLCDKNVTNVKKGTTYTLPEALDFITEDGTKTTKAVTYELKNAEDASFVTLDGLKITPKAGISESGVELVASTSVAGTKYTATVYVYFLNEDAVDNNKITLKLHYSRPNGDYTDWNAWIWSDGLGGQAYNFVKENGEMVATVKDIPGRTTTRMGFKIRLGEWKQEEPGGDRHIDLSDVVSGTVHYYVESGVFEGVRKFDSDTITGSKIVKTAYDRTTNKVTVTLSTEIEEYDTDTFAIKCTSTDSDIAVTKIEKKSETEYVLTLGTDISSLDSLLLSYTITYDNYTYTLMTPNVYGLDEFEAAYTYTGNDLGLTYGETASTFKLWAPTADAVQLNLYESGTAGTSDAIGAYSMTKGEKGVWSVTVQGDLNGKYYTYTVDVANEQNETVDPYARTTGVNGKRAMILDLDSTDPTGWADDANKKLHEGMKYTDAVIYELHVRDLSSDSSSGVSAANRGKFLGLTETGTTTAGGQSTALDHMIDLGITHLHLIPVYDYGSVDETKLDTPQFNWGYDPVNYNVPEGSYSTNPYDGSVRVAEMKQMVKTLHDNNINVVMDVVYNHVYDAGTFSFNQVVPKYFSRTWEDGSYTNGSGCGNDTASERSMVRKYIVDSILYWHEEYHIDGFRFDLVGLLDTVTIQQIVDEVHDIDPDIIFYGEGWDMVQGAEPGTIMATQANSQATDDFAFFNDRIRNLTAGNNNANGYGFVWGNLNDEDAAKYEAAYLGRSDWCYTPSDTVNYASCHDNYTLMDKINIAYARELGGEEVTSYSQLPGTEQVKLNNLSASYYMFSMGIPLVHAGEDMLRMKFTEDGEIIHNSYNSSDYVNKIRWSNLDTEIYADTVDYYEGLIAFRKNHESLRLATPEEVTSHVSSYRISNNIFMFSFDPVDGEVSDGIVTIYNASTSDKEINIYDSAYSNLGIVSGDWYVCVDGEDAGTELLAKVGTDGKVNVAARSAMALVKVKAAETADYEVGDDLIDTDSVYTLNNNVTVSVDEELTLGVNAVVPLTATVNPANSTLVWESDNTAVATVDAKGRVTAIADGVANITVSTLHGVKATCKVTVDSTVEVPLTITIDETEISLVEDASQTLTVIVSPIGTPVTYTSNNTVIAVVDHTGKVTAINAGTTTITATLEDGQYATCKVTVTAKPATPTPTPTPGNDGATGGSSSGATAGATLVTPPTTTTTPAEDTTVEVETETNAATEVPETVTEVTPVVDEKLQSAIANEAEKIIEDILNDELAEGVMSEETLENVKEAQEDGEGIVTQVIVDKLDESKVEADVKEALEKALTASVKDKKGAETKIAQYLDLTVLLKTTSGQKLGEINKLSKEMTFTIAIPEDLVKENRAFVVLRMHEGETTVLETTMNSDGTVSFKTDRFSTYALAYVDMPAEETVEPDVPAGDVEPTPSEDEGGNNVATFIIIGLIIVIIAALVIIFFAMKGKKEK